MYVVAIYDDEFDNDHDHDHYGDDLYYDAEDIGDDDNDDDEVPEILLLQAKFLERDSLLEPNHNNWWT